MALLKKKAEKTAVEKVKTTKIVNKKEEEVPVSGKKNTVSTILIRPIITEKSTMLSANHVYVFEVAKNATKIAVAMAIRSAYGIQPESVHTQNVRGKVVRRGRISGKRKAWKKAIVKIPDGKSLNVYEGV